MKTQAAVVVIAVMLLVFFVGFQAGTSETSANVATAQPTFQQAETQDSQGITRLESIEVPAVDRFDKGVITLLNVEARSGTGRVYIDYSQGAPLLGSETQNSILVAVEIAKKITGKQLKNTNLYFSLSTDAQEVGGASAGAAAAVVTAALLDERQLNREIIITGTIDADGRIGPVGRILEKAQAAKKAGFKTFLVPPGESKVLAPVEKCIERRTSGGFIQSCETVLEEKSVESEVGIEVFEVGSANQAFAIMTERI